MQLKQFRVSLSQLFGLISFGVLVLLLSDRFSLSLIRYFDADELAYLHWAHNVFSGVMPYRDFLLYVPPGFLYILAPIYLFFQGTMPLFVGRVVAFGIFVAMVGVVMLLFWRVRRSWMAVWAGIFLVFLPLPSDKLLEIRPDNLAVVFTFLGLLFQIDGMRGTGRAPWVWAGFWYIASVLMLPKSVPQVAVAGVITLLWALWEKKHRESRLRAMALCIVGGSVPLLLFFLWIIWVSGGGNFMGTIVYSLGTLPFEVNRIGTLFGMQPDLFFYPNATYYGRPGWAPPVIANHAVWFIGLMAGSIRLFTPFLAHGRKGVWIELLIVCSMMSHIVAFFYGYPLRHAQYLIPIAVFVAFYAADALDVVRNMCGRFRMGAAVFITGSILLLSGMITISRDIHNQKLVLTNEADAALLAEALAVIPYNAYVLDMVGSTIYFKDPYPVCCVPFGQWAPYLSRPLPSLTASLEQTDTQYIYEGRLGRLGTLSKADRQYISAHFVPYKGITGLLVRKK